MGCVIDLHSHTTESDGTFTPAELLAEARSQGVRLLAITDHDTLAGYDLARPLAADGPIQLVCGIELSVKFHGQSVHLLGYFPQGDPGPDFRDWIAEMQSARRDRNRRLVTRLRELGLGITLEEVEALGRNMVGRPHFARLLVEKGYVSSMQQAFDEYLDASAKGYVNRREPTFAEGALGIRKAGGIASLAHPVRVKGDLGTMLAEMTGAGLNAIEAYHSDHDASQTSRYCALAIRFDLLKTGGSDFHGDAKPGIKLGTGRDGNLRIPEDLWTSLRQSRLAAKIKRIQ